MMLLILQMLAKNVRESAFHFLFLSPDTGREGIFLVSALALAPVFTLAWLNPNAVAIAFLPAPTVPTLSFQLNTCAV